MKKKIYSIIFWVALGCMLLSLGLGILFQSIKLSDVSGVCFVIFLISAVILIMDSIICVILRLNRQIKLVGLKRTVFSVGKWFVLLFVIFAEGNMIFKHKTIADAVLSSLFYSTVIALMMNFYDNR